MGTTLMSWAERCWKRGWPLLDHRPDHGTPSNQASAANPEPTSVAAAHMQTRARVTAVTRRLYEDVWNAGRYEVAKDLFHRDFAYPAAPGPSGPEAKLAAI